MSDENGGSRRPTGSGGHGSGDRRRAGERTGSGERTRSAGPRHQGGTGPAGSTGYRKDAAPERRAPRPDRPDEPPIADDVSWNDLDRTARARLRTLSKANAERVGAHLVMAGRLLDDDPEAAYQHAQAAVRRAGRVDVVREAAALAAYATGRYAEALRELRTVRRLSGVDAHRAIEADCERGLGRPERALALVAEAPADLEVEDRVELAIVASGARLDLGEPEAALSVLERAAALPAGPETRARIEEATHAVLVALGRAEPEPEEAEDQAASGDETLDAADDGDVVEIDDVLERP